MQSQASAPAQAAGAIDLVDARSDIFSMGKTLAALVADAHPPKRLLAIAAKEPEYRFRAMTDTRPIKAIAKLMVPNPLKIALPPAATASTVWAVGLPARSNAPSAIIQNDPMAEPKYVHRNVDLTVSVGFR